VLRHLLSDRVCVRGRVIEGFKAGGHDLRLGPNFDEKEFHGCEREERQSPMR